jgi:hypothetical protein
MPRFEVFCPAAPPAVPGDVALRVEAEHWLGALKAGLQKVGLARSMANLLCDVQADGSIHVSDPAGGGIFRIRELRGEASPPTSAPLPASPRGAGGGAKEEKRQTEDALAELFAAVADLARLDRRAALERVLDLALEEVDAEAGSILLLGAGRRTLEFAVARGPRAKELVELGAALPVGAGLAGFCVREDVCLAVSDAERDPRFHRAISEAIGYPVRSLLCAPIARRGEVLGALEVLNKRGGAPFGAHDLAVVSYLAHQAAEILP